MSSRPSDVAAFLRDLKGTSIEEAKTKAQAAGYRVVTLGPDDPDTVSADMDINRLTLQYNAKGIVTDAWTG